MNNDYLDGFIAVLTKEGLSKDEAMELYKSAAHEDPNAQAAGIGAGISAPGPQQLGQGQPPLPGGDDGAGGIPPEIEQLIQSLPPEVLQQLLAEIQQEVQGGQGGDPSGQAPPPHHGHHAPHHGAPPSPPQGGPPGLPKQGEDLLCKKAEYIQGFFEEGDAYGLTRRDINNIYKEAVARMEQAPVDPIYFLDTQEKRANHYEGFMREAIEYGCTIKQAQQYYFDRFANK